MPPLTMCPPFTCTPNLYIPLTFTPPLVPPPQAMIKDKMECVVTCQRMIVQRLAAEGGAQDGHALCAFLGGCVRVLGDGGGGSVGVLGVAYML